MAKSQFMSIRIEPTLKDRVETLFGEMGITTSDAVTMFFAQVVNRGEIPFTIRAKNPNAVTLSAIEETEDMISGKIPLKTFNVEDMDKWLEEDGASE
ncbi:MAG: type II toxin-antitoxin system RelB/DinJ family antitoxin [Firmicutes bacterium]|nr:type II toxin-antitoxin system RelB/DinJ family antitoxin [Bacillota bacterium]